MKKEKNKELINYNVVLQADARKNNVKDFILADDIVRVKNLNVPKDFRKHPARQSKIIKALRFYIEHGYFDSPVSVIAETNEYGKPNTLIIVDGVTRYVVAKRLGIEYIPVKYIDINTYCEEKCV